MKRHHYTGAFAPDEPLYVGSLRIARRREYLRAVIGFTVGVLLALAVVALTTG